MSATELSRPTAGIGGWIAANSSGNVAAVLERGFKVIRNQNWMIVVSGFFERVGSQSRMQPSSPRHCWPPRR